MSKQGIIIYLSWFDRERYILQHIRALPTVQFNTGVTAVSSFRLIDPVCELHVLECD